MDKITTEISERIKYLNNWHEQHRREIREQIVWTGQFVSVIDELRFLERLQKTVEKQ